MLFECATITSVSDRRIKVDSIRGTSCARCARGEGCGGGIIGKLVFLRQPTLNLDIPDGKAFEVGETVELSLSASRLLKAAAVIYLLPLVGLFAGALVGHWWLATDLASLIGALVGLIAVAVIVRSFVSRRSFTLITPTIRAISEQSVSQSNLARE